MHPVHDMNDASQLGEARRRSLAMADGLEFDEATCDRLAGRLQRAPAIIGGWLIRGHVGGRDDSTVIVVRAIGGGRP